MFNNPCKICEQKDREIEYLKVLVDNLLQRNGVAPVISQASDAIEETDEEVEARALKEKGALRYGD